MIKLLIEEEFFLKYTLGQYAIPVELIIGTFGILILLEATRRAIGSL